MSLAVDVEIESTDTAVRRCTQALIDCGATGCFIDIEWAKLNNIPTRPLTNPIPVYNVDGTANEAGMITDITDVVLRYDNHSEHTQLAVTRLGKQSMILGYNWLCNHNPEINWQTKEVKMSRCPHQCSTCRVEDKREAKIRKSTTRQINACWAGAFPKIVEEVDEDESPHMNTNETDEEAQDTCPAFDDDLDSEVDDDLDSEVDDFTIEENDRVFMTMVHPVDPHHFVCASSTVSGHLAEAFAKNSKPKGFEDIVPTTLHEYADVFSETAFDSLPERRKWDHAIELEREPSPGFQKVYPMTLTEQTKMDAFLEEALATGRIRQSKSPLGAPVFFIKKKDGKLRFVQDYRALNAITRKNWYPLPLIDDLIHRLKDARYVTKLDVHWGYNNVRIREGDEWKAAFCTNRGLFEPLVMYFGLTNSLATFQTMMNEIFQDLITEGVVSVYLDDILIFTNSLEEHRRITCLVLDRMREHKLYLRPEKCEFKKTRIEYLGVIISHNKVEMDPVKIAGVADWPMPSNKKEVQSFVGFVNFYRHFIPGFSHHARALFDLTMKDVRFIWGLPQEDSFMKLKELITSAPVLVLPNDDLPFRLEADGSSIATGAVLSQQNVNDNMWHPVTFLSKALNPVEQNYEIHDTEMLAIIRGLEEWRHYLEGARHPVEIWTDHKNLEYF
jgi:hypothetical protein